MPPNQTASAPAATSPDNSTTTFDPLKSSQGKSLPNGNFDPEERGPNNTRKRINPNPFSFLVWAWVSPYVNLASRQGQIAAEDLPYVRTSSETKNLNDRFRKELFYTDKDGKVVQRSLQVTVGRVFFKPLLVTGLLHVVEMAAKLLTPMFIGLLLTWFESEGDSYQNGILYVVGLVSSTFIGQGLIWAHSAMIAFAMGMDIRTVCNSQVYRKAMALSPSSRAKVTTGELVTYMSTDCEKLPQTLITIHQIWTAPCIIILGVTYLYHYLGAAAFVGVAVLILSIPMQAFIAIGVFKAQKGMAKFTDKRNNLVNEALQGIKILKLYGWEQSYQERIENMRQEEMKFCAMYTYRSAYMFFMFIGIPLMLNVSVFLCHWGLGGDMSPSTVFTAIALMGIIRMPMVMIPMTMQSVISASIAFKRMDRFFRLEEMDIVKEACISKENAIELKGDFTWGAVEEVAPEKELEAKVEATKEGKGSYKTVNQKVEKDEKVEGDVELQEVKVAVGADAFGVSIPMDKPLEIKKGELVAIVGTVGSGKSSLLGACLGELEMKSGHVGLDGTVGYAAQSPWIVNNTLRGNILMGKEYDQARFNHAVATCALGSDIDMLPAGVDTEIGEKGINLSGGQKARVALARAVYFDPDIYMLDDPLSAVDAHVGKHLFEKAIKKEMNEKGKTVLFATNQLHVLDKVDRIIVVVDGKITETGDYNSLIKSKGNFAKLMAEFNATQNKESKTAPPPELARVRSSSIGSADGEKEEVDMTEEGKLIEVEGLEKGGVDLKVFELYFVKAVGSKRVIVGLLILSIMAQATQNIHELMTAVWSEESEKAEPNDFVKYFTIWTVLGIFALILALFRARAWAWQGINASLNLHDKLLTNVLRCRMSFFDTTPIGRVLNRFTKDFYMVDLELPRNVSNFIVCLMSVIGSFTFIGIVLPWFFIVMGPILYYYYCVQRWYRPLSRDLQRIESASRSPIFASFSESVAGVMSVRAYGLGDELCAKSDVLVDCGNNAFYLMHSSNRWLQVRLDGLAGFTMAFVCFFIVLGKSSDIITVDAGMAGLLITYVQMVTGLMNWTVRMGCETEARITSVERIVEYSELQEVEASPIVEDYRPPQNWPTKGDIILENLSMRYREGLPLVLNDVNLTIPGGSKVGVAGRTGSGKSSLLVSLFRLAEPTKESKILIDDYDCCKGGLKDVRSAISIIPQDPVMFQGTVKSNIDPVDDYSDDEIMKALKLSELADVVTNLDDAVDDGGSNYSVGQRQLFCLARAMLRNTKILVLDEATANVDVQTDEKLQATLRQQFKECTVITIAHRLNTISDSDYILVMNDGMVGEFGSPTELQKNSKSLWSGLLKSERGS
ncbi:hypothetical protein TrVE_jg6531 [Triparma verrucosa]|uniref:Uncharacterized protein n=1 Tax=Triparma verrucosa TaxID=1606542 RepID=A0A9W7KUC2_9STRA|nr:hypothetical protein TrVE_jg6531 [Triparma verrucosa]